MLKENYFDNAATTPVDDRVVAAMLPYFSERWGNANSLHEAGLEAAAAVERARASVARLIGAEDPSEIVFTSGATESNNWVLRNYPGAWVSPFEHSSIDAAAKALHLSLLPNDDLKILPPPESVDLISIMKVNNEIGTIFDPEAFRPYATLIHSDITQAAGKVYLDVCKFGFDFASLSAHKFYGPKGVGAMYIKGGESLPPLLYGGEHERGARAGTLNVAGIVGMGVAAEIAADSWSDDWEHAMHLKATLFTEVGKIPYLMINGSADCSPYIVSLSFLGIEGETLVVELDRLGYGISSGAACSSRSSEPSHVLSALHMPERWLRGTIRISFGRANTLESTIALGQALYRTVEKLRRVSD